MLDLNSLKIVNDTAGQTAGDARRRAAAEALSAALPPGAEAGRWGGDEFVGVIAEGSEAEALGLVARLHNVLPHSRPGLPAFAFGAVTVPAGSPFERALALADAEMHECKERQHEEEGRVIGRRAARSAAWRRLRRASNSSTTRRRSLETASRPRGSFSALSWPSTISGAATGSSAQPTAARCRRN